jgi:hypothetical protein
VLPHEVLEMIAMKAVIALFAIYRVRLLPRADVLSLVTICSVCREWYAVFSTRSYNRRKLGRCLKGRVRFCDLCVMCLSGFTGFTFLVLSLISHF